MSVLPQVQRGADALTSRAEAVVARAAARAAAKESPLDVMRHARDGLRAQHEPHLRGGGILDRLRAEGTRVDRAAGRSLGQFKDRLTGPRHSSSLADVGTTGGQVVNRMGEDLARLGKADGALQTVGAAFALMTSAEQLLSAPAAAIPFPAFPALRVGDYDIGLPHAHAHWPNTPPVPPLMLPSTGPVIPLPFVSGANKTLINGMPAARCGDLGLGVWCGGYVPLYEVFLGSASVWIEGARAARMGVDVTNHCIFSARKGPDDKPLGPFIGFTIMGSPDVIIGGAPMPSLTNIALGAGFRLLFKGAGRVLKALGRAKAGRSLAAKLGEMGQKAKDAWKKAANRKAAKHAAPPDTIEMPAVSGPDTIPDMPAATLTDQIDTLDIILMEFPDEVRNVVRQSPTLSDQLRRLQQDGWVVRRKPEPSVCNPAAKEITIQDRGGRPSEVGSLAHEAGHASGPGVPDLPRQGLSEAEYVRQDVDNYLLDEGRAQFNEARVRDEILSNGGPDTGISGTKAEEYADVYDDFKNGLIDQDQAVRDMADIMRDEITGNTGQRYEDYYANYARQRYNNP
ncbi:MAG TPA: PAAR domain-containing protein [Gemmataceae bacterium]